MATFEMPKDLDKIQEPEVASEGWYTFEVVNEPEKTENKKLKEGGPDAEGAGYNLTIALSLISDNPKFHGKRLTKYLAFPVNGDDEKFYDGQSKTDEKLDAMKKTSIAFGHEPEGTEIEIDQGDRAQFYVRVEPSFKDEDKMVNALCMNTLPRPCA